VRILDDERDRFQGVGHHHEIGGIHEEAGGNSICSVGRGGRLATSPEAGYLAARDKAIAEIKALEESKASESAIQAAEDKAAADLEKRLRAMVGRLRSRVFAPPTN
jgi:hypothetical protein